MKKINIVKILLVFLVFFMIMQTGELIRIVDGSIFLENTPPNPPVISGPTKCILRKPYTYNFTISDPDGHRLVAINILYGDGTNQTVRYESTSSCNKGWRSGMTIEVRHTWKKLGNFTIEAKVQDVLATWGNWGRLPVTISQNKEIKIYDIIYDIIFSKISNMIQYDYFMFY